MSAGLRQRRPAAVGLCFDACAPRVGADMAHNHLPVIAGNIGGGSMPVALVYWAICLRGRVES
jgi:formate/nitrite transporter FocA (FNT family)